MASTELTYNYQWELRKFLIVCHCGAHNCRGEFGQPRALTAEEAMEFRMNWEEPALRVKYDDDIDAPEDSCPLLACD